MNQTCSIRDTIRKDGTAVLMARIVDSAGSCIRREQVSSIGYAIDELDSHVATRCKHGLRTNYTRLEVHDVFLDSLECDRLWSVDVAGYNFRHTIHASADGSFPKSGAVYEIHYVLTPKFGQPIIIRFNVRVVSR